MPTLLKKNNKEKVKDGVAAGAQGHWCSAQEGSQATFPENNVWLHGRETAATEEGFSRPRFPPPTVPPPETLVPRNQTFLQALPKRNSSTEKQAL